MAEVKVSKESSQGRSSQPPEGRGGGLMHRGELFPSFYSFSPRDFFTHSPFQLMRRLTEDMDRFFAGHEWETASAWAPPIEVREEGNQLIVSAELPGLNRDDVKVEVTDEGIILQGERKRQHEEKREGYYRSERSYGRFYRTIPLPEGANVDQIRANFSNGVLEISVPVPLAEKKRREVPIESTAQTRASGGGS